MKQNRDCEFRRHVVEGLDNVSGAFFDHACGEERRIDHVVGLRRILDVKVGHDSQLGTDDGRISLPIYPDKQTISEPVGTSPIVDYNVPSIKHRRPYQELARDSTFATEETCHLPPRADLTPRSLSALAMD